MIILDTNVASELGKSNPSFNVLLWIAKQPDTDLYTTAVNVAEMLYGTERLPDSRRRNELAASNDRVVNEVLNGRVLPFDSASARAYAEIRAARERIGRPFGENLHRDCMIAAIARVHGAAVATRDLYGFDDCGIEVINPWAD